MYWDAWLSLCLVTSFAWGQEPVTNGQDGAGETGSGEVSPGGETEGALPRSRCLWSESLGPIPGHGVQHTERLDTLSPASELAKEIIDMESRGIEKHEIEGYIKTKDPFACLIFGNPIVWDTFKLGGDFSSDDHLLMNTIISTEMNHTICFSDWVLNWGNVCKEGLTGLKEEGIFFSKIEELGKDYLQGVKLTLGGKIAQFYPINDQFEAEENITGNYVCKSTGLSDSHIGLLSAMREALREYANMISYLDFDGESRLIEDCPNLLTEAILKAKGLNDIRGNPIRETDLDHAKETCVNIMSSRQKKSLLSYIFTNRHETINNLLSSSNKHLLNIRILDHNLRKLLNFTDQQRKDTILLQRTFGENLRQLKSSWLFQQNIDNIKEYETFKDRRRDRETGHLYDTFNRAELLIRHGRRLIDKIMRSLSEADNCFLGFMGDITCTKGHSILTVKDHVISITSRATKLEIKTITQPKCLFLNNYTIFAGNGQLFVKDNDLLHSSEISTTIGCVTKMRDNKYDCSPFFTKLRGDGEGGPDQFSSQIFYVYTEFGVYLQNMGGSISIALEGSKSLIITKQPQFISKDKFPIQISGKKFRFSDLEATSMETNLNFQILKDGRQKLNLHYLREKNKNDLVTLNLNKIYGSFSELYDNNFTVRAVSISSIISVGLILLICIIFCIHCCSRGRAGERRYLRYRRRQDPPLDSTREEQPPASAPPAVPESRRRADPESKLQRLLSRL